MQYISFAQVFIGALISMVAGFLWYSPILFGKKWQEEMGSQNDDRLKVEEKGNVKSISLSPKLAYGFSFLGDILTGTIILVLSGYSGLSPYAVATICWLGFVVPIIFGNTLYEGKSMLLFSLSVGYRLVSFLLMATIFSIF